MIDLHAHVLWGLDDGPATGEESQAMLDQAWRDGVSDLVAASHYLSPLYPYSGEKYREILALASCGGPRESSRIRLHPGGEWFWSEEVFHRVGLPDRPTLAGSRYLLLELPGLFLPGHADQFLFRLQLEGVVPVLAHPERHLVLSRHPERLQPWIERGVLVQLTAGSLTGEWGAEIKAAAGFLVKNRWAHFLASDAHHASSRPPLLSRGVEAIAKVGGSSWARTLVEDNPRRVLEDRPWEG